MVKIYRFATNDYEKRARGLGDKLLIVSEHATHAMVVSLLVKYYNVSIGELDIMGTLEELLSKTVTDDCLMVDL